LGRPEKLMNCGDGPVSLSVPRAGGWTLAVRRPKGFGPWQSRTSAWAAGWVLVRLFKRTQLGWLPAWPVAVEALTIDRQVHVVAGGGRGPAVR